MKKCRALFLILFVILTFLKIYGIINNVSIFAYYKRNDIFQGSGYKSTLHSENYEFGNLTSSLVGGKGMTGEVINRTKTSKLSTNLMAMHGSNDLLSRQKRYILFPDGSTFTVVNRYLLCFHYN